MVLRQNLNAKVFQFNLQSLKIKNNQISYQVAIGCAIGNTETDYKKLGYVGFSSKHNKN